MNTSIFRVNKLWQNINVGGFELGQRPVKENLLRDRIFLCQIGKHRIISGKSGFCFFPGCQPPFLKKNFLQLLRGSDIKLMTAKTVNLLYKSIYTPSQFLPISFQLKNIQSDTFNLHTGQYGLQWHLHIPEDGLTLLVIFQFRRKQLVKTPGDISIFGGIINSLFKRHIGKR